MSTPTPDSLVGQLVAEQPRRARLFDQMGIDYCCGGKQTLKDACHAKGVDLDQTLALLAAEPDDRTAEPIDFAQWPLTRLADHIEQTHHALLKTELPRLWPLLKRIAVRHSDKNPRLAELVMLFAEFQSELLAHMAKEEQVLFPLIRQIEAAASSSPAARIERPIQMMELDHQHTGDHFAQMRQMTGNFSTPPTACNTYRSAMQGLSDLEADMHQHIHKENNILFPRALAAATA